MRSHPFSSKARPSVEETERLVLFVGDDWAEDHHDVEIVDETGRRLGRRRFEEGAAGLAGLHALIADHLDPEAGADQVLVGIETDRGPWVQALLAAGYVVYAVNPLQASRYWERHGVSGADRRDTARRAARGPPRCGRGLRRIGAGAGRGDR